MDTQIRNAPRRRRYRKRRRAELEAETRRRITEAAMRLHGTVGPARTTVKAIAEEAGVQRATVYRHFPDEEGLFLACSAHWASLNPPPDPAGWKTVGDPGERLRLALAELYEWYEWAAPTLEKVLRDAPRVPALQPAMQRFEQQFAVLHETLMRGRRERGRRRGRVAAAIGHAIAYTTWHSLIREQGLGRSEGIALMDAVVAAAAEPSSRVARARGTAGRVRRGRTPARR
jgi:AcrR family transcriptional regulator